MAIDPYEPELAKRAKTYEIAEKQLSGAIANFNSSYEYKQKELRDSFTQVSEALKDYHEAAKSLAEWVETGATVVD